jgi:hypothetical protein
LWSREICCDECNNAIGAVESNLHKSLAHTFAAVGATNDERSPLEVTIEYAGREFVLADGNATLQVLGARFDRATKSMIVPLPAGLDAQADAAARTMWSHGWGPDDVHKLSLAPGDPDLDLPAGPAPHEHDLKVGGSVAHKRVFVKMGLELLACHRHDLAMRGELSEARRFARHGEGTFRGKPDTRSEGSGLLRDKSVPEVFNAIEVWSFGKSVYFRVVFLGPVVFTGTLATEWTGEPFRAAYAFDARNPANVIENRFGQSDGPNLAIWFDAVSEETGVIGIKKLEEISLRLAASKPRVEREPPPDIEVLRAAVRERLAQMPPKRKAKK